MAPLAAAFGDVVTDGGVDRAKLSAALGRLEGEAKAEAFKKLEAIVHPLVTRDREDFLAEHRDRWLAVVDIPLLFETEAQGIDAVLTVSCSQEEQRRRALKRPSMTPAKLDSILGRQLDDETRRRKADFVVDTSHADKAAARAQVARALETLWLQEPAMAARPRVVSLDLDDTVWPLLPPLLAGKRAALEKFPELMPLAHAAGAGPFPEPSGEPAIAHDITAMRRATLRALATEHGDPADAADELLEVLVNARSEATAEHVHPDVLRVVDVLKRRSYCVGALTNGNARPAGDFGQSCDFWLTAGDIGASKPGLAPFIAVASRARCPISSIVHVGDSVRDDAVGALKAGARAIVYDPDSKADLTPLDDFDPQRWTTVTTFDELPDAIARWEDEA